MAHQKDKERLTPTPKILHCQTPKIQRHREQLQEINVYFDEKGKDLFDDLKETEDALLKNFNDLEEIIDDSKYAILDLTEPSIEKEFNSIKEVVSRFQGLPLKERKGSSKNNDSKGQAREISEKWSALKVEPHILKDSVLSRFQLSYDNIMDIGDKEHLIPGRNIKLCLLCFSVFPPKSVIKKRPLIYWWLGEGLITKTEDGERIFGELIKKGLLIAKYKPYKNPVVDSCTMHSWNRLMLISVAKRAEFFDFDDDTGLPANHTGLPANHGTRYRRMCLVKQTPPNGEASRQDHTQQHQNSSSRAASTEHRLLTSFNVNEQYVNISNIRGFSEENKIEVLQLGRWQDSAEHHIEVENEDFLKALGEQEALEVSQPARNFKNH
ncbi:hypothetical protein CK203_083140 [Vitis vinifera]|uniref:Uncharacterized protein n=1 Tax=Vitis vinifera TaxID=29760 RepID=A0A438DX39_VITVI|nr:hypothetical protein CK203_083140 [Vitis vinifera]